MSPPPALERVRAIDWLRGLAVLMMIQCHAFVLLRPDLRVSPAARELLRADGVVAPAFLFSAGFALALLLVRSTASGKRVERLGRNLRRILQVLGAATLVNWMWFPLFREPRWLARMDILHCVGLSLLLLLGVGAGLASRPRVLRGVTLALAFITFFLSPLGEDVSGPWAFLLNKSTGAVFPLLPWLGFAWLGAYAGAVTGEQGRAGLVRALLLLIGLGLAGSYAARPLKALYPDHHFYVTNPSNAAERWLWVCIPLLVLVALEAWRGSEAAPSRLRRFVESFGSSSLSAYVIHLGLLYFHVFGFSFEVVWGNRCGWGQYALLTGLLMLLTYALCQGLDLVRALPLRRLLLRATRQGRAEEFARPR